MRTTHQDVLIIGHTVRNQPRGASWLYPYLVDRASVQMGLEGIPACRPKSPSGVVSRVLEVDADQGVPMTVVIVHAGTSVALVRVHYSNGVQDSMAPIAGQAVLVTVGTTESAGGHADPKEGLLQAFATDGHLIVSRPISLRDSAYVSC